MRVRAAAVVAALAASVGCNSTPTSPNIISSATKLTSYVAAVQTVVQPTVSGVAHSGGTVSIVPGGPTVTVTGPSTAVNGGASVFSLHGTSAFQHVFLSVGNTGGAVAPPGFYEVDASSPATDLQILVQFGATLPTTTFDLQFQVTDNALQGGPTAVVTTTAADTSTASPAVLASYNPSPAPFLGGVNCVLSSQKGCLWEFSIILQESNGVGIPSAVMTETFTFGSTVVTKTLNLTIPPHGTETVVRNFACGTGGTACATPDQLAGGTYTYSIAGTDQNLNPFTLTGPILTLSHQ